MAIPLKYNLRSLWVRRVSTGMILAGIALAVAVFIGVMALAKGLETAFTATGEAMNLVVLRQGSQAEVVSSISREALQPLSYLDGVATDARGRPLVSPEVTVVVNLPRQGSDSRSNVLIRGLSPQGFALRPSVRLMAGRALQPGLRELVVSRAAAQRFQGLELGARVKLGRGEWSVVGHFEAHQTAFDSEVWADVYELAEEFDRQEYSSVLLKAVDDAAQAALIHRISEDQRLHLKALREEAYYAEQTTTAAPVKALGFFLAVLMAIGTAFAAMNTMYAAVAHRTREIATLRVLGFRPHNILLSFLIESLILSLSGGGLGCLLALPIHGTSTGTTNFQTFSEIAFAFRVTPDLLLRGLLFALLIGFLGGALPARLAARQLIARAFRGT